MRLTALALVAALVSTGASAWAQDEGEDAAAIRHRAEEYVAAYNQHDAEALANLWAEDAVYLNRDTGEPIEGRPAIAAMFKSMFDSGEASKLSVTVQSVRLVTPEVAIEDGTAEITPAEGEPTSSTYTAIHVKRDGAWYINSVRETDTPTAAGREPNDLDQLAWLVGDWEDSDAESLSETSFKWTKGRNFLVSTFRMSAPGWDDLEGHQFIGWDPVDGVVRSWMFDTDGGFGSGVWTLEEDRWVVEFEQTLPDGREASCTNIYTAVDADHFTFESVDRVVDGEELTDSGAITATRKASAADAAPTDAATTDTNE
jgi:uncharacterized protein (TIGR02246 family)